MGTEPVGKMTRLPYLVGHFPPRVVGAVAVTAPNSYVHPTKTHRHTQCKSHISPLAQTWR